MNKEVKELWLKALRSGEYKQGRNYLEYTDPLYGKKYCCLGVLCDLAVKNGVICKTDQGRNEIYYETNAGIDNFTNNVLPTKVQNWAEIYSTDGDFNSKEFVDKTMLTELNDSGKYGFNAIANIIEENF